MGSRRNGGVTVDTVMVFFLYIKYIILVHFFTMKKEDVKQVK